jgi:hypothetical protein
MHMRWFRESHIVSYFVLQSCLDVHVVMLGSLCQLFQKKKKKLLR